jgi:hypothetical protein
MSTFEVIDWVCVSFFTFDYFARLLSTPRLRPFVFNWMNTVDFLSFFPYYIEELLIRFNVSAPMLSAGRMLRLLRIFRIFKLSKYSSSLQILLLAMQKSRDGFVMLLFTISVVMLVSSSAIFYAEQLSGQEFDFQARIWVRDDGTARYMVSEAARKKERE